MLPIRNEHLLQFNDINSKRIFTKKKNTKKNNAVILMHNEYRLR